MKFWPPVLVIFLTLCTLVFGANPTDVTCPKCEGQKTMKVKCHTCDGFAKTREACRSCEAKGVQVVKCPTCDGFGITDPVNCTACGGRGNLEETCPSCRGQMKKSIKCSTCSGKGQVKDSQNPDNPNATVACDSCGGNGVVEENCTVCEGKGKLEKQCRACEGRGVTGKKCTKCNGNKTVEKPCPDCKKGIRENPCPVCKATGFHTKTCDLCRGKGILSPKAIRRFSISNDEISFIKGTANPVKIATQVSVFPGVFRVTVSTNVVGHYLAGQTLKNPDAFYYVSVEKMFRTKPSAEDVRKKWLAVPSDNAALCYLLEK